MHVKKITFTAITTLLYLLAFSNAAHAITAVPQRMNIQYAVSDGGGGLAADASVQVQFNIIDESQNILYSEVQDLEIAHGIISAALGDGVDPDSGGITGGIPLSTLTPDAPRFLEIWIDGELQESQLELVSAPYAQWSERALSVADASIHSASIASGAIRTKHLHKNFIAEFTEELTNDPSFSGLLQGESGATGVGVDSNFHYSGADTVQGVLEDFDFAIAAREQKNVSRSGDTMLGQLRIEQGGLDVTGNIAVSGTVDGVDVSALNSTVSANNIANNNATSSLQTQITVATDTLSAHSSDTTTHGSNGAIVGMNTLNSQIGTRVAKSGDTMTGDLSMGGNRITNVATPTSSSDAATRQFVLDSLASHETNPAIMDPSTAAPMLTPQITAWALLECRFAPPLSCELIRSYNISSVTFQGNYLFDVTFTTPMPDKWYFVKSTQPYPVNDHLYQYDAEYAADNLFIPTAKTPSTLTFKMIDDFNGQDFFRFTIEVVNYYGPQ